MRDQHSGRSPILGRTIYSGSADGEAIVSLTPFPLSGVTFDLRTGVVNWAGHELTGQSVRDKILVIPEVIGFAGGDWALYALSALYQTGPRAILCGDISPFIAAGAILGKIVTIADLPQEMLRGIANGSRVLIDSGRGIIRTAGSTVPESPNKGHGLDYSISEASAQSEFQLTPEEREILDGSQGRAASDCLKFLVQYGKALGAVRLIARGLVNRCVKRFRRLSLSARSSCARRFRP
ncbi:MAG: DUF126 domain-containing protein [Betaproteobacteria bacterium]|nr:DUF126 domain-containing protein [Betaproteobacteria bacterium]